MSADHERYSNNEDEYDAYDEETINMMNPPQRESTKMELNMSNLSNQKKDQALSKSFGMEPKAQRKDPILTEK
jgi:hypothetical protein